VDRPPFIQRFSGVERALHWAYAGAFLLCLATGLALTIPEVRAWHWQNLKVARELHLTAALLLGAAPLVAASWDGFQTARRLARELVTVVGNLVENAVDFAHEKVRVNARYDRDRVDIVISDDGPGFSPEILVKIGEPFVTRRTGGKDKRAGGLGLGLFIAKTLLERTGATVVFENGAGDGKGAVIRLSWPRSAMDAANSAQRLPQGAKLPYVTSG